MPLVTHHEPGSSPPSPTRRYSFQAGHYVFSVEASCRDEAIAKAGDVVHRERLAEPGSYCWKFGTFPNHFYLEWTC